MKSKKYIISILSIFIILFSYIIYENNSDTVFANINKSLLIKSDVENIKKRCNDGDVIYCEFDKIVNSAIKGETDNVMKYLEKIEKNKNESYPIDCHGLAHTIGKIFYYHIGIKNTLLTKNICTAGIYHGAFEEWGTNSEINEVKKEIPNICDIKEKNSITYDLCLHGTGRALYRSLNDVKIGSNGCIEAFKNDQDENSCFVGVLASQILMDFAKKFIVKKEYLVDLLNNCEKVNNKFIDSCITITLIEFIKQKYLWRMPINDKEKLLFHLVDEYAIFCQNLDKEISKRACAQGIGAATVEIVATFESEFFENAATKFDEPSDKEIFRVVDKEDILKSMDVCKKFIDEIIGDCIGGAVVWVLGHTADGEFSEELCSISNTSNICINLKNEIEFYKKK